MATKTENNLTNLRINILTQDQYSSALQAGELSENELYMTPMSEDYGEMPLKYDTYRSTIIDVINGG